MNQEDQKMINEYIGNCINLRNNALYRGQLTAFVYYQAMADILGQIITDEKIDNLDKHEDVT